MFSPQARRLFQSARGFGHLAEPTHQSRVGDPDQGHYFDLQLQLDADHHIQALAFYCPRCLPAIACGAYLYEFLLHKPVSRADDITAESILLALGGLPVQRSFYAWMAAEALSQALGSQ